MKIYAEEDFEKFIKKWVLFYIKATKYFKRQFIKDKKEFLTGKSNYYPYQKFFRLPDLEPNAEKIRDEIFYYSDRWSMERLERVNNAILKLKYSR